MKKRREINWFGKIEVDPKKLSELLQDCLDLVGKMQWSAKRTEE